MTEGLDRLKARRHGHRGVATRYCGEVGAIVQGETEASVEEKRIRLTALQNSLEEKLRILRALDEDILSVCATDDITTDIEETETVNSRIAESIESCKRAIEGINSNETEERASETRASTLLSSMKNTVAAIVRIELSVPSPLSMKTHIPTSFLL